jgi:vacuolar protein sorting-associated protein VTA1
LTAKKFLAAANFLQVLNIFPKSSVSEGVLNFAFPTFFFMTDSRLLFQTEEKIRYAKWKAADIAKAFREGRRSAPGPPGWAEEHREREQDEPSNIPALSTEVFSTTDHLHSPDMTGTHPENASSKSASGWTDLPFGMRNTSETHESQPSTATFPHIGNGVSTRGSTISDDLIKPLGRSGTGAHTIDPFSGSARGPLKKPAWTNEELEGKYTPSSSPKKSSLKSGSPDSDKRVRFSPTTLDAPPSPTKSNSSATVYTGPETIYAPTSVTNHVLAGYSPLPPPANTPGSYIYAPSSPPRGSPPRVVHPSAPVLEPFELTPEIIAKAQKRCRYAISALDYEDVETARKELQAALTLLEG